MSWRWLNICLLMGSIELISCFALLVCIVLAFLIEMSLAQPMSFLAFTVQIHSLILLVVRVTEWLCGVWLLAGVKPWHLSR